MTSEQQKNPRRDLKTVIQIIGLFMPVKVKETFEKRMGQEFRWLPPEWIDEAWAELIQVLTMVDMDYPGDHIWKTFVSTILNDQTCVKLLDPPKPALREILEPIRWDDFNGEASGCIIGFSGQYHVHEKDDGLDHSGRWSWQDDYPSSDDDEGDCITVSEGKERCWEHHLLRVRSLFKSSGQFA